MRLYASTPKRTNARRDTFARQVSNKALHPKSREFVFAARNELDRFGQFHGASEGA